MKTTTLRDIIDLASGSLAEGRAAERADVLRFMRAEQARYDKNAKGAAHDEPGRERCRAKASVLTTVIAYIERGDHLVGE